MLFFSSTPMWCCTALYSTPRVSASWLMLYGLCLRRLIILILFSPPREPAKRNQSNRLASGSGMYYYPAHYGSSKFKLEKGTVCLISLSCLNKVRQKFLHGRFVKYEQENDFSFLPWLLWIQKRNIQK